MPTAPWPGYPVIPIFLDTRVETETPSSQRSSVTTLDTSRSTSPILPLHGRHRITVSPPDDSPNTSIQVSSTKSTPRATRQSPPQDSLQSPVRHLSPVEYPSTNKLSESWTTRNSKSRTPHTTDGQNLPSISSFHFGNSPPPSSSRHIPSSTTQEKASGLGISDLPHQHIPPTYVHHRVGEDERSSLNITQRIEDKLWNYSIHGNIFKKWLLEIISWVISAICMGAIIGVLLGLKDNTLNKWPLARHGISLNTYVATLSRIASAALLLPVSEALGQLKWNWFFEGTSKKMWDFEIFDNASRGPWGSLQLLVRTKGRKLAALGAAIVLFALAMDPFFQQLLDFPERWTLLDDKSTIPRVTRYEPEYEVEYLGNQRVASTDQRLISAANRFFYDNGTQDIPFANGTRADFPIYCPSSNCTWPVYETLGVCSACADVSELLEFKCMETPVDWIAATNGTGATPPNPSTYPTAMVCGHFLNSTSDNPVLVSGYAVNSSQAFSGEALLMRALPLVTSLKTPLYGNGSIKFKNHRNPIADVLLFGAADGHIGSVYRNDTPIALECVLSWCVKTIKSSYALARYTEEVTSSFINETEGPFPWKSEPMEVAGKQARYIEYLQPITLDVSNYTQDPAAAPRNTTGYQVSQKTAFNIANVFKDIFPSFVTANQSGVPLMRYATMKKELPHTKFVLRNPWLWPNNVTNHMERLAKALTDSMRSATETQDTIEGKAYEEETYIAVRWAWLTLPIGLLGFSLIFLVWTMFRTYKQSDNLGVWKTSAIATLLYGLPDDMQKKIKTPTAPGETPRSRAKELKVKLGPKMGWRASWFSPLTPKSQNQPPPGWI